MNFLFFCFDTLEEANRKAFSLCGEVICGDVEHELTHIYVEIMTENSYSTFDIECYKRDNPNQDWREDPSFTDFFYQTTMPSTKIGETLFDSITYYDIESKYAEVRSLIEKVGENGDCPSLEYCKRLYTDCRGEAAKIGLNAIAPHFFYMGSSDVLEMLKSLFEHYENKKF